MVDIPVRPPPDLPRPTPVNPLARLMPVVMAVATVGMMVFYFSTAGAGGRNPMFVMFPLMMAASLVGTMAYGGRGNKRTAEINDDRRDYLRHLRDVERQAAEITEAQRRSSLWRHPDPDTLWTLPSGDRRRWGRRPSDIDFGVVRVGVGPMPPTARFSVEARPPSAEIDPVTHDALRALMDRNAAVAGLAVTVDVAAACVVTISGDGARAALRAMLCQLATFHDPDHVRITAAVDRSHRQEWDWIKWLPHCHDSGPTAHVVVVVDGYDGFPGDAATTAFVIGDRRGQASLHLHVATAELVVDGHLRGVPDALTVEQAAATARRMSGTRVVRDATRSARGTDWLDMVGIADPVAFDVVERWRERGARQRLRVPIGTSVDAEVVELDIKEAAEGGVGPHGLCVGATGSGKSEFLRTLVLGMVTTHPPEALNLVLIDFKGGATFLGLERLAHVAAVITNLADEAPLVDRMSEALAGEMYRRQELLRSAGNFANVADYERARADGARLSPLPALFIVVDEFSELLSHHPDLAELFAAIGRLGRSLRMHLLLSSQRIDEGRMRGLESHLSYRICLKTFSASESRAAIGIADAYELPARPGAALLRVGSGELIRFDAAYVSGPCRLPNPAPEDVDDERPRLFTASWWPSPTPVEPARSSHTVAQAIVERLSGNGIPAHRVWLAPLGDSPALSSLLNPEVAAPAILRPVQIGVVDCPFEQRRSPLIVDVAGAAGHVAVVGAPQVGKSTAVRSLVSALALVHSPRRMQFYCLDLGGGGLAALRRIPHVGAMATRFQPDLVRRIVAEVESVVRAREAVFASAGVDSIAEYRQRCAAGEFASDPYGDVFLVVDGWAGLRQEFDDLEGVVTGLAARGLSHGVHVVVTAARWAELRPAFKDLIGSRIELRLGDPADSEMDRKRARLVSDAPGRGVNRDGRLTAIALPRLDGLSRTDDLGAAAEAVAAAVIRRWGAQRAPEVRLLPTRIDRADLDGADVDRDGPGLVIGLRERGMAPAAVDFVHQPHLIILGDVGSGKTATLRTLCTEIMARRTPDEARFVLVDVRRTLLGVVDGAHLADYAMSVAAVTTTVAHLLDLCRKRLPGADVTQAQLRDRTWWHGPDVYVVVDDYDLVATADGNPLSPILELLPYATDVGLHVIVARRSGGAGRALYEPLLARVKESGAMGLLMSASLDEGMLWNPVRPSPLPPGRATLVTRAGAELIHVAWTDG